MIFAMPATSLGAAFRPRISALPTKSAISGGTDERGCSRPGGRSLYSTVSTGRSSLLRKVTGGEAKLDCWRNRGCEGKRSTGDRAGSGKGFFAADAKRPAASSHGSSFIQQRLSLWRAEQLPGSPGTGGPGPAAAGSKAAGRPGRRTLPPRVRRSGSAPPAPCARHP